MFKNKQGVKRSWFFIILLTISSLALAGTAAYFSVFGLAKLFYGAGLGIIILASVLEFSKLVAVSYVYRYWSVISTLLRIYYIFGIVFIMILTSMGIYGFLTSAYQKSANKIEIRDSQIKIAENKKTLFVDQLKRVNDAIESSNTRINNLSTVRLQQERRLDTLYNRRQSSTATRTERSISGADEQIKFLNQDITDRMKQASSINDSIAYYDQKIVEYKASDVSSEVGPLKYLSDLTGIEMNKVVNILVLLIIFVFDPMAIALLIGVNQLTMMEKEKKTPLHEERINIPKFFKKRRKSEEQDENKEDVKKPNEENKEEVKPTIKPATVKQNIVFNDEPIYDDETEDEIVEKIDEIIEDKTKCPEGYDEEKMTLQESNIKNGLRVYHEIFGYGNIIKSDNKYRIHIQFDNLGIKELNPEFANLKEIICVEKITYMDFAKSDSEDFPIQQEKEEEMIPEIIEEPSIIETPLPEAIDEIQEPPPQEEVKIEDTVEKKNQRWKMIQKLKNLSILTNLKKKK